MDMKVIDQETIFRSKSQKNHTFVKVYNNFCPNLLSLFEEVVKYMGGIIVKKLL